MDRYLKPLMGLISGIALMMLNNTSLVNSMERFVMRVFPKETSNALVGFCMQGFVYTWDLIMLLSIIGVFITIIYSFIILRIVIKKDKNKSTV